MDGLSVLASYRWGILARLAYGMLKLKLSDDILTTKTLDFVIVTSDNNKWPC